MAIPHNLKTWYTNFKGLDKRNSALSLSSEYATEIQNALYRKSGAINKRFGYHAAAPNKGGYGLQVFNNYSVSTGETTSEILTLDENLHKIEDRSLTITYSGTSKSPFYAITLDTETSTFRIYLYRDSEQVFTFNLGNGITDAVSVATVAGAINASGIPFSASYTGTGTVSASIFSPIKITNFTNNTIDIIYREYSQVATANSSITDAFTI